MPTVIENVQKEGFTCWSRSRFSCTCIPPLSPASGAISRGGIAGAGKVAPEVRPFFSGAENAALGPGWELPQRGGDGQRGIPRTHRAKPCAYESIDAAVQAAKKAMHAALNGLSRLYDGKSGEVCYVPDTSALLHNTQLDAWQFEGVPAFTMVLTPTVLSELDEFSKRGKTTGSSRKPKRWCGKLRSMPAEAT